MIETIKKIQVDGVDYDIQAKELTKVTYAELREMRDNGSLAAGHLYRITDYEFTTVQKDTKSAGHVFDIIVLATTENQLSHIARAIAHEGDTYFDGNDLDAWELWYDLDNDVEKYEWADAENGKGIIYRMIDEKGNDCPYDFKNALFYNTVLTTNTTTDKYYYTFSCVVSGSLYDGTSEKQAKKCYKNSMGVYVKNDKKTLNLNVFVNTAFWSNCYSNTFGNNCYSNTFGSDCYSNTFGNSCYSNTFGSSCYTNTFGAYCSRNTFGNNCYTNTFRNSCSSNIFWNYCYYNTFNDNCGSNTFEVYCDYNTFGNSCYFNTFGSSCEHNIFGNYVSHRNINQSTTSVAINDEYFDDGSGQLVPIKHPDLSTQPSILPYKFMGQYVYEQLIPINKSFDEINNATFTINADEFNGSNIFLQPNVGILEANLVLFACHDTPEEFSKPAAIRYQSVKLKSTELYGKVTMLEVTAGSFDDFNISLVGAWLRIVYTSMPEKGDYYGYENY